MKLAVVCTIRNDFGRKGFYNTQEIGLGRTLARQGHEVTVIKCLRMEKQEEVLSVEPRLTVHYLPIHGIGAHGYLPPSMLPRELDGVLCFSDHQIFLPALIAHCKRHGIVLVPYIGTIESIYGGLHSMAVEALFRLGTRRAYRRMPIVAKSEAMKRELEAVGARDVRVAKVGLDTAVLREDFAAQDRAALRAAYGYGPEDVVICNVARFHPEKRGLELLKMFLRLREHKRFRLLLVGEGPLRGEVDAKIAEYGIGDSVQIFDRVPYDKMWEIYCVSDYFVNLNQQEIFGMAIMEAIYYHVPVGAITAPGPNTILRDMPGHLLAPDDEALERWLAGPYPDAALLERSAQNLVAHFGWEDCAAAFLAIIREAKGS